MSAVRAAASTTMWAKVMGSSGLAAAGTTYQWGTGDVRDSSAGLQSSLGLVSEGLGLCPCRMAGVEALISCKRIPALSPNPSPAQGVSHITLTPLATEERGAPRTLREDSRRK